MSFTLSADHLLNPLANGRAYAYGYSEDRSVMTKRRPKVQTDASQDTPAPLSPVQTMSISEAKALMESARSILTAFADGQILIREDGSSSTVIDKKPTVQELRARASTAASVISDSRLPAGIVVHEPKRQRKQRQMAPRRAYSLKAITTRTQMQALQQQTPAAGAIMVYLATHPKASVPELAVQLDLKRKTIENLLSVLRGLNLVEAHDR